MVEKDNLKWEYKEKLNPMNHVDDIKKFATQVVSREMDNINQQIDTLHRMGLIKDCKELRDLKVQMKKLNIESENLK